MRALWQQLSPTIQRWGVILGTILVAIILVVIFSPNEPESAPKSTHRPWSRHVFTDRNPSELGLDSLSADVKAVAQQQALLTKTLTELQHALGESAQKSPEVPVEMAGVCQGSW